MTIALTYNNDLSRVQVVLSGLAVDAVRVERSTNELFWQTVRGGTELPVTAGAASLDDFEFAPNVENFYRVLPVDPVPGLQLPGASGDFASTPDAAALDIVGDIDIRADVTPNDPTPASVQYIAAKFVNAGSQASWRLFILPTGILQFGWSEDGSTNLVANSTVAPSFGPSGRLVVRATLDVDNGAAGRTITVYTADSIGGPWTQLGSTVVQTGVTSIFASTAPVEVGSVDGGTLNFAGIIHAVEVRDGINGTVVADPDFAAQATGTTNFVDDAGRAWTVNGNAEIVGNQVLESDSITPVFGDCEIWIKSIRYPLLNQQINIADYSDIDRPGRTGVFDVTGRSFPVGVTDVGTSVRYELVLNTETADEQRKLSLALALGDILFLHIPPDTNPRFPPRSIYFVPSSARVERVGLEERRRTYVPLAEVAVPSPFVVGTVLIWQTVFNTFGDWNQLISAEPSWSDLLATVASGEDLVVI